MKIQTLQLHGVCACSATTCSTAALRMGNNGLQVVAAFRSDYFLLLYNFNLAAIFSQYLLLAAITGSWVLLWLIRWHVAAVGNATVAVVVAAAPFANRFCGQMCYYARKLLVHKANNINAKAKYKNINFSKHYVYTNKNVKARLSNNNNVKNINNHSNSSEVALNRIAFVMLNATLFGGAIVALECYSCNNNNISKNTNRNHNIPQ